MENQAWTLRSLLAKLEKQEAEGEDSPNSPAGEFVVSPLLWFPRIEDIFLRQFVRDLAFSRLKKS